MAIAVRLLVDVALEYAERGWYVFPLVAGGKTPLTAHGLKDATTDSEQIGEWWTRWPDANVGIATGRGSDLVVVDVDPRHGGTLASLGELPRTARVRTGGGGWHLYFRYPQGEDVRNSSNKVAPGIDVRGEGGYVVAPGSLHESGRRYEWEVETEIADIPQLMTSKKRAEKATVPAVVRGGWLERAVARVVDEGEGRNDAGFWLACQLRDDGVGETEAADILAEYQERVAKLGDHEYTVGEARANLTQAYLREARQPAMRQVAVMEMSPEVEFTDTGNAIRLARRYSHCLKYVPQWGWLAYSGGKWNRGADGAAMQYAKACVQGMLHEAAECTDGKRMLALTDHARKSFSTHNLTAMLKSARSEPGIVARIEDFDADPMLVNVVNGTVDLRTGALRPHSPKDMLTKQAHFEYDREAKAPRFEQFLREVFAGDEDSIAFVQRALGYSITGDTREQVYFICYGTGSNGKSTLLGAVQTALGDYASPLKADALMKQRIKNGSSADPELASLVGARFVVAQEPQSGELDTAKVKEWTGGDPLQTREPFKMPFKFVPQFKLWLSTNDRPDVTETTVGIWRRTHLIPFTVNFEGRKDVELPAKLHAESSGILNWLIAGCLEWRRQGIGEAKAVKEATREYHENEDPYLDFFESVLVRDDDPESKVVLGDAYNAFRLWQHTSTALYLIDRQFTKQAEAHGYPVKRSNGKRWLRGCRIASAASVAQGHFWGNLLHETVIEEVSTNDPLGGTIDTAEMTVDEFLGAA